jgi:hypothetical protein
MVMVKSVADSSEELANHIDFRAIHFVECKEMGEIWDLKIINSYYVFLL